MRKFSDSIVVAALLLGIMISFVMAGPLTENGTQPPLEHGLYPPNVCRGCHSGMDHGHNIRPYKTWSGSLMANAARDPIFWASLDVANNDIPGVGDFCLRCHTPPGWLAGRSEPPLGSVDGCSLDGNIDDVDNDFEGIHCTACHRMMVNPDPPAGQEGMYLENGQFWIDDEICPDGFEPCRRGNYDYLDGAVVPPHDWQYDSYYESSEICGNCHNVTNPAKTLIDEAGVDTGVPMPVERTYREWTQSDFAAQGPSFQTCQNCHMPDAMYDPASPCTLQTNNRSGDLPVHEFAGGNAWVPGVLRGEYPDLNRNQAFMATEAWAEEMLANAATLELQTAGSAAPDSVVSAHVTVTNLSGHKLPTGYPEGRRMWLQATLKGEGGETLWQSGAYDAATGELAFDSQIKVYQVKPGIWNLNGTNECDVTDGGNRELFHFVLNDCVALDNRIPPPGFTGGTDIETKPVNYTYPETSPGSGILVNYDITDYSVDVGSSPGDAVTLEVNLLYQTISKEYVDFLHDEAVDNGFPDDCIPRSQTGTPDASRGEILYDLWTQYDRAPPVVMATASVTIPVALFADGFESGDATGWSSVQD